MAHEDNAVAKIAGPLNATLDTVREALTRMRFGAINLIVHDGRVVQIDVTERKRFSD